MRPGGLFTKKAVVDAVNRTAVAVELAEKNLDAAALKFFRKRKNLASNLLLVDANGKVVYEDEGACTAAMSEDRLVRILESAAKSAAPELPEAKEKPAGAETYVRDALKATARRGAVWEGTLERGSPFAGFGFAMGADVKGKLRVVSNKGDLRASVVGDNGTFEVLRRRGVTTRRLTWTGGQAPKLGATELEVMRIADLAALAGALKKIAEGAPAQLGDAACRTFTATVEIAAAAPPGQLAVFRLVTRKVTMQLHIGANDGLLRAVRMKVEKGLPQNIGIRMPGQKGELKFDATYELRAKTFDDKVEVKGFG